LYLNTVGNDTRNADTHCTRFFTLLRWIIKSCFESM
jgi:hypothetical protein